MDMDAAPALKRKGANASELWLDDAFRAAKSRRLDADVPPVVPGAAVPPTLPVAGFGVQEMGPMCGDAAGVKRKGADAPELWLNDDGGHGYPAAFRATKSRRLDADLPPVVPSAVVPPPAPVAGFAAVEAPPMCGDVPVVPVEVAAPAASEEKAIVLYRPAEAARSLLLGPLRPGAPLRVSPDWIHGLKGTILQETSDHRALYAEAENSNLAMVPWAPWAPSRVQATDTETMDDEDTSMDVEQDRADQSSATQLQWPQQLQHCMVQQPLPAASYQPSQVTWSW